MLIFLRDLCVLCGQFVFGCGSLAARLFAEKKFKYLAMNHLQHKIEPHASGSIRPDQA
jgi:hypothetical protein